MTARAYKFTTANDTNLRQVAAGPSVFLGGSFVNTTADPYYIKLYWVVGDAPTVGTTVPNMTIGVPPFDDTTVGQPGTLCPSWPGGVTANGRLYIAVTGAAADSDTTAVAAGQGVITLLVDGAP